MTDREKVIKGLECCVAYDYKCNDCPYQDDGGAEDGCYSDELKADAIALLKAQEPVVMAGAELTDAELIEEIRKAPLILKPNVDAAPVVRCRDCEFYGEEPIGTLKECYRGCGWTKPSDYCSRGKRRESE